MLTIIIILLGIASVWALGLGFIIGYLVRRPSQIERIGRLGSEALFNINHTLAYVNDLHKRMMEQIDHSS